MKTKRVIMLLVVLAMMFSIVACSQPQQQTTAAPTTTTAPTTSAPTEAPPIEYPTKPIRIIVCRSAGGSTDIVARTFQPYLQKYLGGNIIVENIDGAAGRIGLTEAHKSDPDGYTLVFGVFPSYVLTQHIEGNVDYKMSDFIPIYNVNGGESNAIVVPFDSPFQTLEDLVQHAKENPGTLTAAVPSGLSNSSLGYAVLLGASEIDVIRIPYESGATALQAAMGQHVDFTVASAINVYQPAADNRVRVLAVFNPQRDPNLPDVQTFAESYGDKYAYEALSGLMAPPNTPAEIISILEEASAKAVADPEFVETASKLFQILPLTSEEFEGAVTNSYAIAEEFRDFLEALLED